MTYRYLLPIELEADLDDDNPRLIEELVSAILDEGVRTYLSYGDLDPVPLLDIYISPSIAVDDTLAEQRDKRVARLKGFWRHLRYKRAENYDPGKQLDLPGLEVPR